MAALIHREMGRGSQKMAVPQMSRSEPAKGISHAAPTRMRIPWPYIHSRNLLSLKVEPVLALQLSNSRQAGKDPRR